MCFGIEPHGLGSELGLDRLDLAELVRRVFVEDMDHPLAGRGEDHAGIGLISGGIHSPRDRERLDNLSVASIHHHEHLRVAAAVDVRLKTGNELNFLGTGAIGVRPFVAASWRGRVAPHADFGFQWNGNSDIASINGPGVTGKLPNNLFYVAGADARVVKRLTLSADYLGEHVFSVLREGLQTEPSSGFSGIYTGSGSFNTNYITVGGKVNPVGNLLLTANVFFNLDNNGLHNKPAPMVGISYTF